MVSSMSSTTWDSAIDPSLVAQTGRDALDREARTEQPLDHVVVQVAGDAVAVFEQGHALTV